MISGVASFGPGSDARSWKARVVVEVDGKHHFADDSGRADVHRYAQMAAADRELKLVGYEVYRFGAAELSGDAGMSTAQDFFRRLFKRHGVAV